MKRIAVFVSGNGSNFENIARYLQGNDKAQVALLVSNRPDAFALQRAKQLGVESVVWTKADFADEQRTMQMLVDHDIHFIVLAGFLLMVPTYLIHHFPRRILNIHPSLLPKYGGKGMYGNHVHKAVKENGEKETGITIHYVSEVCDGGETILQATTPLSPLDSVDDIATKVHQLEKEYYPKVVLETVGVKELRS